MPTLKFPNYGLWTSTNPFSATPEGTFARADDVQFSAPGVLEPRRGFRAVSGSFGTSGSRATSLAFYEQSVIVHHGTGSLARKQKDSTGSFVELTGTFLPPSGSRSVRLAPAAKS